MSDSIDEIEHHCKEQLARLDRDYKALAKPYIDKLVQIEAMKCPPPPQMLVFDPIAFAEIQRQIDINNQPTKPAVSLDPSATRRRDPRRSASE